jgi:biotin synthase
MNRSAILAWLKEDDPKRLEELWRAADEVRRRNVGDAVHLRGLVEFSNHCARLCAYCGLRAENRKVVRYRMRADEILACARRAVDMGYGTLVLQSGEDPALDPAWLADCIRSIKEETALAVTLSLGEYGEEELRLWREAGADRYLLRFETSNPRLFAAIHPPRAGHPATDRIALLRLLKRLDYETGSGVMIGIPGQSYEDLARDIELFRELRLDMIGVGPFIADPDTPLGCRTSPVPAPEQVPNTDTMTCKVLALTRLVCPLVNLPSTTALATVNPQTGRALGLERGANVIMPNLTPSEYRAHYAIYPGKAGDGASVEEIDRTVRDLLTLIGRPAGVGRGDSPRRLRRLATESGAGL